MTLCAAFRAEQEDHVCKQVHPTLFTSHGIGHTVNQPYAFQSPAPRCTCERDTDAKVQPELTWPVVLGSGQLHFSILFFIILGLGGAWFHKCRRPPLLSVGNTRGQRAKLPWRNIICPWYHQEGQTNSSIISSNNDNNLISFCFCSLLLCVPSVLPVLYTHKISINIYFLR